jgi:hypothetical protein
VVEERADRRRNLERIESLFAGLLAAGGRARP